MELAWGLFLWGLEEGIVAAAAAAAAMLPMMTMHVGTITGEKDRTFDCTLFR
jgi:hypothetical protein